MDANRWSRRQPLPRNRTNQCRLAPPKTQIQRLQQRKHLNRTVWIRAWNRRTTPNRKREARKMRMALNCGRHGFIVHVTVIDPAQVGISLTHLRQQKHASNDTLI